MSKIISGNDPIKAEIERYYNSTVETEWSRLDWHKMEFTIVWRTLQEFIQPRSVILDVGGGPGRYSLELAKNGHHVTLLDLSEANIGYAKQKSRELGISLNDYVHGNALDLSRFGDNTFDVCLLMGPLYHLIDGEDRNQAVQEAVRVLKPGGALFATFVTRFAFLLYMIKDNPDSIAEYRDTVEQLLADGINIVSDQNPGFTNAYFTHPMEVAPFMERNGLTQLRLTAIESLISFMELSINELPQESFDLWADLTYRLGTDPTTWGNSEHMLYVGRK